MILSRNCSPSCALRVSGSTLQQLQILPVHTFGGVQANPRSQTGTSVNNLYLMDLHCQASKNKSVEGTTSGKYLCVKNTTVK